MQLIDSYTGEPITINQLDRGVRKVVAELVAMGAVPRWSCDGHGDPAGWYVVFEADLATAQKVCDRGYFTVSLFQHKPDTYHMDRMRQNKSTTTASLVKGWLANYARKES